MQMVVTRDIARAAGAGPDRPQRLLHRLQDRRVLPHAEIVVRAPHRDFGADAVIEGARETAAAPLEVGKDAIPPLGVQRTETLSEEALVIHGGPLPVALLWLRVSDDPLAGRGCGELVDSALHVVALTSAAHRAHLVVVDRLRFQIDHANPENRLW